MRFNQPDATEKDDSREKENIDKDDLGEESSPLDMSGNKEEFRVNIEGENQSDSTPLLDKDLYNKESEEDEGKKSNTEQEKAEKNKKRGEWK